jgi:hypothetical protein
VTERLRHGTWLALVALSVAFVAILLFSLSQTVFRPPGVVTLEMSVKSDGRVTWRREVESGHWGDWAAELFIPGEPVPICAGSGRSYYASGVENRFWTIQTFVSEDCPARPPCGAVLGVVWQPISARMDVSEASPAA